MGINVANHTTFTLRGHALVILAFHFNPNFIIFQHKSYQLPGLIPKTGFLFTDIYRISTLPVLIITPESYPVRLQPQSQLSNLNPSLAPQTRNISAAS